MKTALEVDAEAYCRLLPDLLAEYPGKFVLIRRGDRIDLFDTFDEALDEGYKRFKRDPFFVKRIAPIEPVQTMSHGV